MHFRVVFVVDVQRRRIGWWSSRSRPRMFKIDSSALSQKGRAQTRLLVVQIENTLAVVGETTFETPRQILYRCVRASPQVSRFLPYITMTFLKPLNVEVIPLLS
jgi:hypothetical protein